MKLHAAIEMNWRAIVSFHFTQPHIHEINHLEPLLESLWGIGNVLADSGYLSRENCRLIHRVGGTPYIKPKKNTTGKGIHGICRMYWDPFAEMVEEYNKNPKKWMKIYHQRSNIEAVFSALKRKLGGYVSSVKQNIQHVEIALKIIVYNLMILVRKIISEEYF